MSVEAITDFQPAALTLRPVGSQVALRPFPYPYRAMLAICSDLDETPDADTYFELMRFLNTTEETSMGVGVGLEIGNSIYFDMPPDQFAYWNTNDKGRSMVRAFIKSGHIDCLHSYGDLATTRAHAARALDELNRHGLFLKVWVDHATAPTNFGADIMRGHGDEIDHPAYHADLTMAHGVRYVWRGRVSSIIGQASPVRVASCRSSCHPRAATSTVLKEAAKQILGRTGKKKYAFHATNRVCAPAGLRDGSTVVEFLRCNPHPRGLDFGDTGVGIAEVLTRDFMDRLVEREGCCILYTHLGKLRGRQFDTAAIESFRLLARYQEEGTILVTTTRRLLDYEFMRRHIECRTFDDGSVTHVTVAANDGASLDSLDIQGLTADVPAARPVRIEVPTGEAIRYQTYSGQGRAWLSIPWKRTVFPEI